MWHEFPCTAFKLSWSLIVSGDNRLKCLLLALRFSSHVAYYFLILQLACYNYLCRGGYVIAGIVDLLVCLSVCLLAGSHKKLPADLDEIFRED